MTNNNKNHVGELVRNIITGASLMFVGGYYTYRCWVLGEHKSIIPLALFPLICFIGFILILNGFENYSIAIKFDKEEEIRYARQLELARIKEEAAEKSRIKWEEEIKRKEQEREERANRQWKALQNARIAYNEEKERLKNCTDDVLQTLLNGAHTTNNVDEHLVIGEIATERYNNVLEEIKNCTDETTIEALKNKLTTLTLTIALYNNYESNRQYQKRLKEEREQEEHRQSMEEFNRCMAEQGQRFDELSRQIRESRLQYEEQRRQAAETRYRNDMANTLNNINNRLTNIERNSSSTILNPYERERLRDATNIIRNELGRYK